MGEFTEKQKDFLETEFNNENEELLTYLESYQKTNDYMGLRNNAKMFI
jgi:hypothetical protein